MSHQQLAWKYNELFPRHFTAKGQIKMNKKKLYDIGIGQTVKSAIKFILNFNSCKSTLQSFIQQWWRTTFCSLIKQDSTRQRKYKKILKQKYSAWNIDTLLQSVPGNGNSYLPWCSILQDATEHIHQRYTVKEKNL